MTKIEDRYWIETDSFVHSPHPIKSKTASGIKGTEHNTPMFMLLIHNTQIIQVFQDLKFSLQHKPFVVNQTLFILHNIQTFLLHTLMVLICIQDNLILIP